MSQGEFSFENVFYFYEEIGCSINKNRPKENIKMT
jgi:hypothetical protein